jgi:Icc-related predicted phosphoesterase
MKIALASDLHLEFEDLIIKNTASADVLVLAGDILLAEDLHDHPAPINPYSSDEIKKLGKRQLKAHQYRDFISRCAFEFPHVVVIAGNHEFYHGRWNQSIDHLYEEYSKYSNVHFLEADRVEIDNVLFIGGTLWTNLNKEDPLTIQVIRNSMNDYSLIRDDVNGFSKLVPAKTLSRHRKTLDFFDKEIKKAIDKKIVVVSHMAPSSLSIAEQYTNSIDNAAYYSDLSEFILDRPEINLWVHGHVHSHFDYMIGNTRVCCHPRGYVGYERGSQEDDPYWPTIIEI